MPLIKDWVDNTELLEFIKWVIEKELDFSMGNESGDTIEEQAKGLLEEFKKETA